MKPVHITAFTNEAGYFRLAGLLPEPEFVVNWFRHLPQTNNTHQEDVIVVDCEWAEKNLPNILLALTAGLSRVKIMVVNFYPDAERARALMAAGVTGILLAHELNDSLQYLTRAVLNGRIVISPVVLKQLLSL